jgi:hypothetical protein
MTPGEFQSVHSIDSLSLSKTMNDTFASPHLLDFPPGVPHLISLGSDCGCSLRSYLLRDIRATSQCTLAFKNCAVLCTEKLWIPSEQ